MFGRSLGFPRFFALGAPPAVGLAVVGARLGIRSGLVLLLAVIAQGDRLLAGPLGILARDIGLVHAGTRIRGGAVLRRTFEVALFIGLAGGRVLLACACVEHRLALAFGPQQILAGLVAQGLRLAPGMQLGVAMTLQVVGFDRHQTHDVVAGALGTSRDIKAMIDEKPVGAATPFGLELRLQDGFDLAGRNQGAIGKIRRGDGTRRVLPLEVCHQRLRILPGGLQRRRAVRAFHRRSRSAQQDGANGEQAPSRIS